MAGRGRTSYQKRQKEQLRLERRQSKAARKQERKLQKEAGLDTSDIEENPYLDELDIADDDVPGLSSDMHDQA